MLKNADGPAIDAIHVGETFFVQVRAQDRVDSAVPGDVSSGVIALPLTLSWDPNVITLAGDIPVFPVPIPVGNRAITEAFPLQRFADEVQPGTIKNLRGGAIPASGQGRAIGKDDPGEFSVLQFKATSAGTSAFTIELAGSMSFADADPLTGQDIQSRNIVVERGLSSLSGYVYDDEDLDGDYDKNASGVPIEAGLPKVEMSLFLNGALSQKVWTGPDGWYHFEDLEPGTYTIRETQPPSFVSTKNTPGTILKGNDLTATAATNGDDEFVVQLGENEHGVDFNFGEAPIPSKRWFLASSPSPRALVRQWLGVTSVTVEGTENDDTISVSVETVSAPEGTRQEIHVKVNNQPDRVFSVGQFDIVTVDGLGGKDTVTMTGSIGDEFAHFFPGSATLRSSNRYSATDYALEAWGEDITVDAEGGADLAMMRDSPGDDDLTATGDVSPANTATTIWNGGVPVAKALNFEKLRVISLLGGTDRARNNPPPDFEVELLGNWDIQNP